MWDQAGNSSGWNAPASWSMGLLKPGDWQAKWIGLDNESHDHVGVGLIGAQWLMRTLSENGRTDLAFKIATQTTYAAGGI